MMLEFVSQLFSRVIVLDSSVVLITDTFVLLYSLVLAHVSPFVTSIDC